MTTKAGVTGIDLIIFDCDGVLVDSEIIANKCFSDYLNAHGIPTTPSEVIEKHVGRSMASCKIMLEQSGHSLPDSFVDDIRSNMLEALSHGIDPIAGIHQALDQIDLPVCVASSGRFVKIRQSLKLTNLSAYFEDNIFSASQVDHPKPAPDLFLLAAKTMGFDPARALVIEDSSVGVQGGVSAHMNVVGFTGGSHCEPGHGHALRQRGAHHILDNMLDLPALINRL